MVRPFNSKTSITTFYKVQSKGYFKTSNVLLGEGPNIAAKKHWNTVDLKKLVVFESDCGFLAVSASFARCKLHSSDWLKHWIFSVSLFCELCHNLQAVPRHFREEERLRVLLILLKQIIEQRGIYISKGCLKM